MIWVLVILLLILTFRWWVILVAGIASVIGPLIGWFLVVGVFLLAGVLFISGMWPVFHHISAFLGPKMMDEVVTPLIGLGVFLVPIIGLLDALAGWPMTKATFYGIRSLFAFKHGTDRP